MGMNIRRLLCLLLGGWMGASLFMTLVAVQNLRSVDRLLAEPPSAAAQQIKALGGPAGARLLLRYAAGEQNRWYFETWDTAQLGLAVGVFFILLFGSREGKFTLAVALGAVAVVAFQRFALTPDIVATGRTLDFIPPDFAAPGRPRFQVLHTVYSGVEIFKWGLIALLAGRFLFERKRRSGNTRKKVDVVDKTDHRHIDG
jgi:hypothetical protein